MTENSSFYLAEEVESLDLVSFAETFLIRVGLDSRGGTRPPSRRGLGRPAAMLLFGRLLSFRLSSDRLWPNKEKRSRDVSEAPETVRSRCLLSFSFWLSGLSGALGLPNEGKRGAEGSMLFRRERDCERWSELSGEPLEEVCSSLRETLTMGPRPLERSSQS